MTLADGVEIGKGALIGDGVKIAEGVRVPEYSRVGRRGWRPDGWEEGDEVPGEQQREGECDPCIVWPKGRKSRKAVEQRWP